MPTFTTQGQNINPNNWTHVWYTSETGSDKVPSSEVIVVESKTDVYSTGVEVTEDAEFWVQPRRYGSNVGDRLKVTATFGSEPPPDAGDIIASKNLNQTFCSNETSLQFTLDESSGNNYQWKIFDYDTQSEINVNNPNTDKTVFDYPFDDSRFIGGEFKVVVEYNKVDACGVSHSVSASTVLFEVRPSNTPKINSVTSSASDVCAGTQVTFDVDYQNTTANPDISWDIGGSTYTSESVNYTVNSDVTANVTLTYNGVCTTKSSETGSKSVTIKGDFNPNNVGDLASSVTDYKYCENGDGIDLGVQTPVDGIVYTLYKDGSVYNDGNYTTQRDPNVNQGFFAPFAGLHESGTYTIKAHHVDCDDIIKDIPGSVTVSTYQESAPAKATLTTNPFQDTDQVFCSETATLNFEVLEDDGYDFVWHIIDPNDNYQQYTFTASGKTFAFPFNDSRFETGTFYVSASYKIDGQCDTYDLSTENSITINTDITRTPDIQIDNPNVTATCVGSTYNFEASFYNAKIAPDISWTINGNTYAGTIDQNTSYVNNITLNTTGSVTAEVNLTSNDACVATPTASANKSITVNPKPVTPIQSSAAEKHCGAKEYTLSVRNEAGTDGHFIWYNDEDLTDPMPASATTDIVESGANWMRSELTQKFPLGTTRYWVTYTSGNGCTSPEEEAYITIDNENKAKIEYSGNHVDLCPNGLFTLTASNGTSWQWQRTNGNTLNDPNDTPIDAGSTKTITPSVTGYYWLTVEGTGCIGSQITGPVFVSFRDPDTWKVNIDYPTDPYCEGTSKNYTAVIQSDLTGMEDYAGYQWYVNDQLRSEWNDQKTITTDEFKQDDVLKCKITIDNSNNTFCIDTDQHTGFVKLYHIFKPENIYRPTVLSPNKKCGTGTMDIELSDRFNFYEWIVDGVSDARSTTNKKVILLDNLNEPVQIQVKGIYENNCESDYTTFHVEAVQNCENYVHKTTAIEDGIKDEATLVLSPPGDKKDQWTYIDGLGRSVQKILQQNSPGTDPKDVVQPIEYDEFGRKANEYLPYSSDGSSGFFRKEALSKNGNYLESEQYAFYADPSNNVATSEGFAYSEKIFEPSPLNRLTEQGAPGEVWQPGTNHTTIFDYQTNESNEVFRWKVNDSGSPAILQDDSGPDGTGSYYEENQLFKNITTDEDGNITIEYVDRQDRTILKKAQIADNPDDTQHTGWACTYYIYDNFDNLRFVLQPQLVEEIRNNVEIGYIIPVDKLNKFAFQYKYDGRKRLIKKRIPGADWVHMVYDNRDRLILTQDGNQRENQQWLFTKYDALNRPVATGILNDDRNRADIQTDVIDSVGADKYYTWYESVDANGVHGYDNASFPDVSNPDQYNTVTYYDNYNFVGQTYFDAEGLDFTYDNSVSTTIDYPDTENTAVKGQQTGSKVKVLDPQGGSVFLNTVTYYDDRYRVIQTITENHLGGTERQTSCFDDLTENVKESVTQATEPESLTIHRKFNYDHAGRLLDIQHSTDGSPFVTIAKNDYNEIGELIKKDLHTEGDNDPWQTVDYQYNIRGWLTSINDANLSSAGDLFGMELYYESGFEEQYYNGNISGVKWQTAVDDDHMAYGYKYGRHNRLIAANYTKGPKKTDDTFDDEGHFNLEISAQNGDPGGYDLNGNILSLKRYGVVDNDPAAIDVLDYDYDGNQLTEVRDDGPDEGFKDDHNPGTDYLYDANGNMKVDANKEIANIEYNFMNLPKVITFKPKDGVTRKIEYIYDAAGIKLAQRVYEDATQSPTKTTDYIGERVYETKEDDPIELQFIHHEEGRIVKDTDPNSTEKWDYQYFLKDHLGNTRLTFGEEKMEEYILTMEVETPANRLIEDEEFENVNITEDNKLENLNHTPETSETPSPKYTAMLNGTTQIIGPGKSLKVLPGDEIEMSVYAKYLQVDGGYDPSVAGNLLLRGFAGAFVDVGGEMLKAKGYVDEGLLTGLDNIANSGNDYDGVPQAYLNYILFDKDYNVIEGKKLQVSEAGKVILGEEPTGDHEHLQIDPIAISEEGYIYIYLSNQTPNSEVYFDDLYIRHTKSRVISKTDLYPYGLDIEALSVNRDSDSNDGFGTGYIDLGFRQYDPVLGRFHIIDPLGELLLENSGYHYADNNPGNNVDVLGLKEKSVIGNLIDKLVKLFSKRQNLKGTSVKITNTKRYRTSGNKQSKNNANHKRKNTQETTHNLLIRKQKLLSVSNDDQQNQKADNIENQGLNKNQNNFNVSYDINTTQSSSADDNSSGNKTGNDRTSWLRRNASGDNPTELADAYNDFNESKGQGNLTQRLAQYNRNLAHRLPYLERLALTSLQRRLNRRAFEYSAIEREKSEFKSEPTSVDDPQSIIKVLKAIHDANEEDEEGLDLEPLKKEGFKQSKIKISGEVLEISMLFEPNPILGPSLDYTIDPSEYNRSEKGDDKFEYVFTGKKTDGTEFDAVVFTVDKNKAEEFEDYLGISSARQLLEDNDELTVEQIQDIREELDEMADEDEKKELYLLLQQKIKYESQRKIDIQAKEGSLERAHIDEKYGEDQTIGDWLCQLSVIGRVLELFGEDNASGQELEQYRQDNYDVPNPLPEGVTYYYYHENYRTQWGLWDKILTDKGYQRSEIAGYGLDNALTEDKIKNDFREVLEKGEGIMIGISRSDAAAAAANPGGPPLYKGHIVRVVGLNDDGLIIDDPYGETDIVNFYTGGQRWTAKNSSSNSSETEIKGEGITWKWSDIVQIRFRSVHKIINNNE